MMQLAIDLHKYFIEMPPPMPEASHPAYPVATNVGGEHRRLQHGKLAA